MIDFVGDIYQNPDVRKNFAALSRIVMKVALDGDPVAVEVIKDGARQLAIIISTCAEVLGLHTGPYRIAATGGLVSTGGWYHDLVQEYLNEKHPDAKLVLPKFEPGIGAIFLGLIELGIEWDDQVINNTEASLKKLAG